MINLSLRLKPSEIKEYSYIVSAGMQHLEIKEYLHYYNLRSLQKKLMDKAFSVNRYRKMVSLRININEFESLKYISWSVSEDPYYNALYISAVAQLDPQINNTRFLA